MKSFKERMTESLASTTNVETGDLDNELIQFILLSFNLRSQTHIYHLLTKSYAEHIAIGEFYDSILETADSIAEMSIGLDIDASQPTFTSELNFTYTKAVLIDDVKAYRENVTDLIEKTSPSALMSINDALIVLQTTVDTLLYKLQLK